MSEVDNLEGLGITAVDQETIEKNVVLGAARSLREREDERDKAALEKIVKKISKYEKQLDNLRKNGRNSHKLEDEIESAISDKESILKRLKEREAKAQVLDVVADVDMTQQLPGETERQYQIRTGKITPFANQPGLARETSKIVKEEEKEPEVQVKTEKLEVPVSDFGIAESLASLATLEEEEEEEEEEEVKPVKRRRFKKERTSDDEREYVPSGASQTASASEFELSEDEERDRRRKKPTKTAAPVDEVEEIVVIDDGNETNFKERYKKWRTARAKARKEAGDARIPAKYPQELLNSHPTISDWELEGGFKLPGEIHPLLFGYQKTCVKWLWELHSQNVGGILGDEMGLGKTVQIISFLAGLHHSNLLTKPVLIVCPLTLIKQWVREFHHWWPAMRVAVIHSSGSGMGGDNFDAETGMSKKGKEVANRVFEKGHVLITTYDGLCGGYEFLLVRKWGYVILDEGHKIKNPDTSFTQACKSLKTPHRIILSGTPMQNNLKELWSLFDFAYPGLLGTYPAFEAEFETPIKHSQYINASESARQTGIRCCMALKEMISPFLLRRLKIDVAADLPKKTEKVILANITLEQRAVYEDYLESPQFKSVEKGKMNQLAAIDTLRKICNHPDLIHRAKLQDEPGYGDWKRSGKMQALKTILQVIVDNGHRTLLFAQTKQMLDILESFLQAVNYKYLRMDGDTHIGTRDKHVTNFNRDESIKVFLLTTNVGGLGLNLIGANRVIIFDPDWNPSTDAQARERSYRLGQKKDVVIYRMLTKGTIEEKIFHRQIFKESLSDMVFKDPTAAGKYTPEELRDIFSLMPEDGKAPKRKPDDVAAPVILSEESVSELSDIEEIDFDGAKGNGNDEKKKAEMTLLETVLGGDTEEILKQNAPSEEYIARDAERFVERAKRNLERSTQRIRQQEIHIPTWTGKSGKAGLNAIQPPRARRPPTAEEVRVNMQKFLRNKPNAPVLQVYNLFSKVVREAGIKNYNSFLKEIAERRRDRWVVY